MRLPLLPTCVKSGGGHLPVQTGKLELQDILVGVTRGGGASDVDLARLPCLTR